LFSNSRVLGPVVSHPDRNTDIAAAISSSPMAGLKQGMLPRAPLGLGGETFDMLLGWPRRIGDVCERFSRRYRMN
jgi:hypothetical protein